MVFFAPRHASLSLDTLSEILRGLHLDGATFTRNSLGADFALDVASGEGARFYFVAQGHCWIRTAASGWLELGTSDAVLVPHGAEHRIAATPGRLKDQPGRDDTIIFSATLRYGGATVHPLAELMPEILRACRFGERDPFVAGLLDEMGREAEQLRIGGATVLARLADVLAAKLVRSWVEGACGSAQGWLAAIRDPQIGRAIAAVHRDPSTGWTVAALAQIAGVSRSKFIERFSAVLGEGPAHYVARWRMHLAMEWLGANTITVSQAASHLGYESDASFSRAFKRVVGTSPAHWRQGRRSPAEDQFVP
jgi:AraC-like DNA-binding protein